MLKGRAASGFCSPTLTWAQAAAAKVRSSAALANQALGYSLGEAREASRAALSEVGVGTTLEDRVKAALRSLVRD